MSRRISLRTCRSATRLEQTMTQSLIQHRQRQSCCHCIATVSQKRSLNKSVAAYTSAVPQRSLHSSSNNSNDHSTQDVSYLLSQLSTKLEQARSLKKLSASHVQATLSDLTTAICTEYNNLPSVRDPARERVQALTFLISSSKDTSEYLTHILNRSYNTAPNDYSTDFIDKVRHATKPAYEYICECMLQQNVPMALSLFITWRQDLQQCASLCLFTTANDSSLEHTADEVTSSSNISTSISVKPFDSYLRKLLSQYLAPGLLQVQLLKYETSPAALIERLAKYEAVHPVQSLDDLKLRLGPDRRVFALVMPECLSASQSCAAVELLAAVHVSLQTRIPSSMDQVYNDSTKVKDATTACFYSITNFNPTGLAGLGLGEYLIKQAVSKLQQESLTDFVTLSPIPRFRAWLEERILRQNDDKFASDWPLVSEYERMQIAEAIGCKDDSSDALVNLLAAMKDKGSSILDEHGNLLIPLLETWAARYLVHEKHRRKPLCSVARFHLGNGAHLYRINAAAADKSQKGWRNSFGVMVNYKYDLDRIRDRQIEYEEDYTVCTGSSVRAILDR